MPAFFPRLTMLSELGFKGFSARSVGHAPRDLKSGRPGAERAGCLWQL